MKFAKRICSLICVFALCFVLMTSPSAHATGILGGQAMGAWVAAGLVALNIVAHTGAQAIGAYFGWQSAPTSQSVLEYAFPNATSLISDYMNASTIKVDQGVTTIDGVVYDEVFIEPGTFMNGLKTNLFDFKTKWQILSGNTGTLASGYGTIEGLPAYQIGNTIRTPTYVLNSNGAVGPYRFEFPTNKTLLYYKGGSGAYSDSRTYIPYEFFLRQVGSGYLEFMRKGGSITTFTSWGVPVHDLVHDPFEYSYTSGIVPVDESEIPENYGLSIQIPHDKLQTFYNIYPQYNVDNSVINIQQDQIDIDELTQAIFDQITSMEDINAEFKDIEEPVPPVPVDPIENIDENVDSINQYQQNMNQQVNHMHQDVESIYDNLQDQKQIQEDMQEIQQNIAEKSESIDDTLKDIKDSLEPGEITEKTFDLRELFPFCIPFDIYHLLQKFDSSPVAPHVQLPIVIPSLGFSYTMDLDFSAWDPVAQAMRTVELIVYGLGLAWATSKVIKW